MDSHESFDLIQPFLEHFVFGMSPETKIKYRSVMNKLLIPATLDQTQISNLNQIERD